MLVRRGAAALAAFTALAVCAGGVASAGVVLSQPFTGTTASGFVAGQAGIWQPQVPCLTAATSSTVGSIQACSAGDSGGNSGTLPDAAGQGALRLNDNGTSQATFVLYGTPFSTAQGVLATFDEYAYMGDGSGGIGAGVVLAVVDGATSPSVPGGQGGSMGYAPQGSTSPAQPGMAGAWAGVGVDESSYWSAPVEGKTGGPGFVANTIAIRGAAATNWAYEVGYQVAGAPASFAQPLAFGSATTRGGAAVRRYQVIVSKTGVVTVDVDFTGTGTSFQNAIPSTPLTSFAGQPAVPATVKLGLAAGTGPGTVHEIQNFTVETGLPDLTLSQARSGPVAAGTALSYTLSPTNPAGNGPTSRAITLVDTLPTGLTYVSATGTSWSCAPSGQVVTCTYSGGAVAGGAAMPPVTVNTTVQTNAPSSITNVATITTANDADRSNNTSTDTAPVAFPAVVQLYKRITQVVSYGPTPGPTTAPVTIVPTPDPTSPPGVAGTTAFARGFYPRDVVTYTVYFTNTGLGPAMGAAGTGPTFSDPLSAFLTYVPSSQTFTCCTSPAASIGATFAQAANTLSWHMASPLPTPSPSGTAAPIQGSFSYQVQI
jgi:uncharacterized repeat protein (TIGR01451 family)